MLANNYTDKKGWKVDLLCRNKNTRKVQNKEVLKENKNKYKEFIIVTQINYYTKLI